MASAARPGTLWEEADDHHKGLDILRHLLEEAAPDAEPVAREAAELPLSRWESKQGASEAAAATPGAEPLEATAPPAGRWRGKHGNDKATVAVPMSVTPPPAPPRDLPKESAGTHAHPPCQRVPEAADAPPASKPHEVAELLLGHWQSKHGAYEMVALADGSVEYREVAEGHHLAGTLALNGMGWWEAEVFIINGFENGPCEGPVDAGARCELMGHFRVKLEWAGSSPDSEPVAISQVRLNGEDDWHPEASAWPVPATPKVLASPAEPTQQPLQPMPEPQEPDLPSARGQAGELQAPVVAPEVEPPRPELLELKYPAASSTSGEPPAVPSDPPAAWPELPARQPEPPAAELPQPTSLCARPRAGEAPTAQPAPPAPELPMPSSLGARIWVGEALVPKPLPPEPPEPPVPASWFTPSASEPVGLRATDTPGRKALAEGGTGKAAAPALPALRPPAFSSLAAWLDPSPMAKAPPATPSDAGAVLPPPRQPGGASSPELTPEVEELRGEPPLPLRLLGTGRKGPKPGNKISAVGAPTDGKLPAVDARGPIRTQEHSRGSGCEGVGQGSGPPPLEAVEVVGDRPTPPCLPLKKEAGAAARVGLVCLPPEQGATGELAGPTNGDMPGRQASGPLTGAFMSQPLQPMALAEMHWPTEAEVASGFAYLEGKLGPGRQLLHERKASQCAATPPDAEEVPSQRLGGLRGILSVPLRIDGQGDLPKQ